MTISAAAASAEPLDDPGLAHLRHLFVARGEWGGGLARRLHAGALEHAAGLGYRAIRLFVPSAQTRARRFYERRGWLPEGSPRDSALGIEVVEYRHALR